MVAFVKIKISLSYEGKRSFVVDYLSMDYDIWNILTNFEVHDSSDLSDR